MNREFPVLCLWLEGRVCHHSGRSDLNKHERQINDWNAEYRVKATEVRNVIADLADENVGEKGKGREPDDLTEGREGDRVFGKRQSVYLELIRGRLWFVWFACKKRETLLIIEIELVCFPDGSSG